MVRFPIRDLLWLMVVIGLSIGWWLDRQLEIASRREFADSVVGNIGRLAQEGRTSEVEQYLRHHCRPEWGGQRQILVISWFHERCRLFYRLSESGSCFDARQTGFATQDSCYRQLSRDELRSIKHSINNLPASFTEPTTDCTVLVSYQSGDQWRTERYDAAELPDEFEKIMLIIGERFETKDRREKKAK